MGIQAPRQRSGTATLTRSASGVLRPELGQGWMRILDTLDETVKAMALNNVPQALSKRFFVQIFCFINVQMFNALLLRRECCSFSNGEYIKTGLAELENWLIDGKAYVGSAWEELRYIRQAVPSRDSPEAEEDAQRDHARALPGALHPAALPHQHDVLGRQVRHGDCVAGGARCDEGAHDEGPEHEHEQLVPAGRRLEHPLHRRR